MAAITVSHLSRTYHLYEKEPGLRGSGHLLQHRTRRGGRFSWAERRWEDDDTQDALRHLVSQRRRNRRARVYASALRRGFPAADSAGNGPEDITVVDIPAMETLLVHKEMYRLSDPQFHRNVGDLAEMLEVESLLRVPVRTLSLGERMKMELFAALVHRGCALFGRTDDWARCRCAAASARLSARTESDSRHDHHADQP
jgi:hypothetical protein